MVKTSDKFQCEICNVSLKTRACLVSHHKTIKHTNKLANKMPTNKCETCNLAYSNKIDLIEHFKYLFVISHIISSRFNNLLNIFYLY